MLWLVVLFLFVCGLGMVTSFLALDDCLVVIAAAKWHPLYRGLRSFSSHEFQSLKALKAIKAIKAILIELLFKVFK